MDVEPARPAATAPSVRCPFSLTAEPVAHMLNLELADHPVYDGLELQWFDDDVHGTGMLAFLSRRAGRAVDYYAQPGLRLDPAGYRIGGGTRSWNETEFAVARLEVADDGVDAHVRFTDVDGRAVEVRVLDRDGRRRHRATLLAPVSAAVERPESMLLVWLTDFDLVHVGPTPPVVRIDGQDAVIGRLPGDGLHRRHLIKYAGSLCAVTLNRSQDGPLAGDATDGAPTQSTHVPGDAGTAVLVADADGHRARVVLDPALPDLTTLAEGARTTGRWHVTVDGARLTGGRWWVRRIGGLIDLRLDVDERWRPRRLPLLMRVVTTVAPVFRRWPTTYRWRARVELGPEPAMTSRWERVGGERGAGYRRLTGS
ncbi:hypothetical protein [Georgenia muralis]|uniref:Uncharacterized protein n=1 Tax=Georgenia muralis TaxID=154117 RepID=A0A3N4Z3I8_9MICO|nr:hypothetical protein [Georgenia muralis]RPF27053.1 hypothetical protein EDD32_1514 [Georgenia muralis]